MIVLGDGKAKGQRMIIDKINELDQLLMPASQITKNEAIKFMKKTKSDSEGSITLGKRCNPNCPSGLKGHVYHYKCK